MGMNIYLHINVFVVWYDLYGHTLWYFCLNRCIFISKHIKMNRYFYSIICRQKNIMKSSFKSLNFILRKQFRQKHHKCTNVTFANLKKPISKLNFNQSLISKNESQRKNLFKRLAKSIGIFLQKPSTAKCNDMCTHIMTFLVWIDSFV